MKKVKAIFLIFILTAVHMEAQHYIGLHKDDIMAFMKTEKKNFRINNTNTNKTYKYLKYEDNISEQTMLFFLDDRDECTYARLMSAYGNYPDIVEALDSLYSKADNSSWTYIQDDDKYIIRLEKGEWFFTINYKKDKN